MTTHHNFPPIDDNLFRTFVAWLRQGKRRECYKLVQALITSEVEVLTLYEALFKQALYAIGDAWERNEISVATEHIATSIIEELITLVRPLALHSNRRNKRSILCCPANEYHAVGARIVADVFELEGWDAQFVGANTPDKAVHQLLREQCPDVLGFSITMGFNRPSFERLLEGLRSDYPVLPIIVGGQAFPSIEDPLCNAYQTRAFTCLDSLRAFLGAEP